MKKVLMISPLPWNIGGVEKRIAEIAHHIGDQIDLVIVSSSTKKAELGVHEWNGVTVIVLERTRFFPYFPVGLYSYLRGNGGRFDLIDLQGLKTIEPVIFLLARLKTPFILTPHHHAKASNKLFQLIKRFYDPVISKRLLEKSTRIICVSEIEKKLILEDFGYQLLDKAAIIGNGIDLDRIRSSVPFEGNGKVVLSVGRLERYKNVQKIILAMSHLPANYRLFIIGDGSYRKSLEKITDDNRLTDRVTFLGRISESDVYRWLRTSLVFINLSDMEAFGISVIEALAAGAPAIVNNRYGLAEIAERFPASVYPMDVKDTTPRALADLIERVSADGGEDLSQYDWPCIVAEIHKTYLTHA